MSLGVGDKAVVAPVPSHLGLPELHEEMRHSLSFREVRSCESLTGSLSDALHGGPTPTWRYSTHLSIRSCLVSAQHAQALSSERGQVPFLERPTHWWGRQQIMTVTPKCDMGRSESLQDFWPLAEFT